MKFMNILKVLCILCTVTLTTACSNSKVPAGYVGVKVYLLGGDKGVDSEEVGVGRYFIGINEELYLFPTFTQNYVWTRDPAESSPNDESITFQTKEGMSVSADIGISYSIDPTKVTEIFQKYRKGVDEITDIYLRNMVRDAIVTAASTKSIEDVYGVGKAELIKEVEDAVSKQVKTLGIMIERVYWVGELRLPKTVVASLNSKIEATQKAQQRRNEVEQSKAEADKAIEIARGQAESKLALAKAEAESIRIKGEALRENPELVKLLAIEKWDGTLPRVSSDSGQIISLDVGK